MMTAAEQITAELMHVASGWIILRPNGARLDDHPYPTEVAVRHQPKTMSGTSMKSWCASTVRNATCGEQLIKTDMCSTKLSRRAATPRPPDAC